MTILQPISYFKAMVVSVEYIFNYVEILFPGVKSVFIELVDLLAKHEGHQLYATLLSGNKKLLSTSQSLLLEVTGTQHIFSVSGMHLGMIVAGCRLILRRFLNIRALLPLVASIWLYSYLVNFRPSIVRAATMTTISLCVGQYLQRKISSLYLLGLAVVFLCAVNPSYLTDVGFQLSVAGVIGVSTSQYFSVYKDVSNIWSNNFSMKSNQEKSSGFIKKIISFFSDTLFVSIFASLFIFPLVVFYFKEATLSSLISNPLVLWLVPYVMGIGIIRVCLIAFFSFFHYSKGVPLLLDSLLDMPINLMIFLLHFASEIPTFIFKADRIPVSGLVLYYLVLLSILIYFYKKGKQKYGFKF